MKLLLNANNMLGGMPEGTKEDINELKETLLEEFEDADTRIAFGEFTFGVTDPETIKTEARSWNEKIITRLMQNINGIMTNPTAFTLDSEASFHLFEAARLADNRFSVWGDAGIMYDGDCYGHNYSTIITKELLEEILKNPEEWAIVDLAAY